MSGLRLAEIYRYPLKSARGERLQEARMDAFGLQGDRRWMLVDATGTFLSQRALSHLALLEVSADDTGIELTFDGNSLRALRPPPEQARVTVSVWGDAVPALIASDSANRWLSQQLGQPARLAYYPDDARRPVDPVYATAGQTVSFADGFPLLVLGQSSLEALNQRLPKAVPMDRFRPNLVITGAAPHAEDDWRTLRIGDFEVSLVKPCARCAVPSIDQASAERDPLINHVLATYRRRDGQIYFGMNALAESGALFREGDRVEIVS